jgi:hypothetical protein
MSDVLERKTDLTTDHRKIVAAADAGELSPGDVHSVEGPSSGDRALARPDDDDRVTFFLTPGQWPRVFPGL